jgi:serine/threonine protein kinase
MPLIMVWPPPKVLKSPEGEVTVERPHGGAPDESSVVTGVQPEARQPDARLQNVRLPDAPPARPAPPALPGATVSVMAATAVPRDWLERPEGLLGCVLGSRYRVVSVIGRGPMGIACEGESSRGRQVTLKLLPRTPALPIEHFAWQLRQALALAHFDHPNVIAISDFGSLEDGGAFVSRSRVPGVSLRTILRQGALPLARSLDIARQIASALAAAHSQDIAHGRLKPENIMVQGGARPGDVIKVVDFGMAGLPVNLRAVAPNENEARLLSLRTRLYLPADVTGASPAIDVYSLGVMLFEMIAGQPPFVFEAPPPPGAQPAPLSFAQCNPSLVVPASVNELVFALLEPRALEHGLSAARAGEMLDALLGRVSVAPAPEPVTAQIARTAARDAAPDPARAQLVPPELQSFAAPSAASMVWPSSPPPAPARAHSFPPLPQGFVSSFPPPAVERTAARSEPPPPPPSAAAAVDPRESTRSVPPVPPSRRSSVPYPPLPPSQQRPPSTIDEPFSTRSFPPPNISVPLAPPAPNIAVAQGAGPSTLPPAPSSSDDLGELELRPSFIGRLKRLFGKKRPSGF